MNNQLHSRRLSTEDLSKEFQQGWLVKFRWWERVYTCDCVYQCDRSDVSQVHKKHEPRWEKWCISGPKETRTVGTDLCVHGRICRSWENTPINNTQSFQKKKQEWKGFTLRSWENTDALKMIQKSISVFCIISSSVYCGIGSFSSRSSRIEIGFQI